MSYTIRSGDTLSGIASRYHVSLAALQRANPQVRNANLIYAGERLNIPGQTDSFEPAKPPARSGGSGNYVVRSGDSMSAIAARNGVSLSALLRANPQVRNPNLIYVGERLNIPGRSGGTTGAGPAAPVGQSVPGQVGAWIAQAQSILVAAGVPLSKMNAQDIATIIQHESSGNPRAINLWDSNAAAGHPSKGLMQTIDSTFNAYKLPGHNDIYNPVDNIIAGVRYAIARYGSIGNVPGIRAVHAGGAYVGY